MTTKVILGLSLLLFSCTSLKKAGQLDNQIVLTKDNISKIDGDYLIFANDTNEISLDLALTFKKYWWNDFKRKGEYSLQLKTINDRRMQVSIFRSGTLMGSKTIKYKIEDGKLLTKKTKLSPFYFIINGFGDMKTRITLLDSNNLSADYDNFQMVTFFIIPLGGDRVNCQKLEFRKRVTK